MNNKNCFLVGLILPLLFCSSCQTMKPVPQTKVSYETLYRGNQKKHDLVFGKSIYKASYGYIGALQQGYNSFYYHCYMNGQLQEMSVSSDRFVFEQSYLYQDEMRTVGDYKATRTFISPYSGLAHIYGTIALKEGERALLKIYYQNNLIKECEVDSNMGSFYVSIEQNIEAHKPLSFVLDSESLVSFNPTIDFIREKEKDLHSVIDGDYGDVHPFYDEKTNQMYMLYLATGRDKNNSEQFSTLCNVSNDMVNFNPISLTKDPNNPPIISSYFALGVYVDADGKYRSCAGCGDYVSTTVSDDMHVWQNGDEFFIDEADQTFKYRHRFSFSKGVHSGRDPYTYYDKESEQYFTVVMNYYTDKTDKGDKSLTLYTGDKTGLYSNNSTRLLSFTGKGDPECPMIIKMKNRWYLFYSQTGTGTGGGVGKLAYRIGDKNTLPQNVNWESKQELYLDGEDLHAAQITLVGEHYYLYGWLSGTPHTSVWGGALNLSREVFIRDDGSLGTRIDSYYQSLMNDGYVASYEGGQVSIGRSLIKATVGSGQSLMIDGYSVGVTNANGKSYLYISNNQSPLGFCKIEINNAQNYSLKVIVEGTFIEAFIDDTFALTTNCQISSPYQFSGNGSNITFYKLANASNILD